jgi:hypothetical protein
MTSADAAGSAARAPGRRTAAKSAAAHVADAHSVRLTLPDGLGTIRLPDGQRLAFYGGIAALAALGILDWPVAIVLGVGHILAEDYHHKSLGEFAEALEEA